MILSAGTIGTPQLLELSGIGNPEVLAKHGIPVVHALPGVGENLRDHFGPSMQWKFNRKGLSLCDRGRGWGLVREVLSYVFTRKGFISQGLATLRVFTRSHEGIEQSDIALLVNPFMIEVQEQEAADVARQRLLRLRAGPAPRKLGQHPHPVGGPLRRSGDQLQLPGHREGPAHRA